MEIQGIKDSIAFCEAMGLSNVFKAYAEECSREDIMEIGFNANSGYVYIALENGITIASSMGQRVEYIVTDFETGEESFFDNYTLALNK
jgi:galactokinase